MSIKNTNFLVIHGWMINELGLDSMNKIAIYAVIYGFSQDGVNLFTGTQSYIADLIKNSTKTVSRILSELCERQLIIKTEITINNVLFYHYSVNHDVLSTLQTNCLGGVDKLSRGVQTNCLGGVDKLSDNNNKIKNINKKENIKNTEVVAPKKKNHAIDFEDTDLKDRLAKLPDLIRFLLLEWWLPYKLQKHEQLGGKHMRNLYVHKGFAALVSEIINDINKGKNPAIAIVHSMGKSWEGIYYPTNSQDIHAAQGKLDSLERTEQDRGLF